MIDIEKFNVLIRESLPAALGDELREVLNKAKKDAKALEEVMSANDRYSKLNHDLVVEKSSITSELEEQRKKYGDLNKRESELIKREVRIELKELEVQLLKQRLEDLKFITNTVFRNTESRKVITERALGPSPHQGAQPVMVDSKSSTIIESQE